MQWWWWCFCYGYRKLELKRIFLIRHAKSDWNHKNISDYYRPLNSRGLRDAPKMGSKLFKHYGVPDLIISSGAKRAKQTAEFIAKKTNYPTEKINTSDLLYHASYSAFIDVIHNIDNHNNNVMIFSHNPGISHTVYELTKSYKELKTCCIAVIESESENWTDISPESCHLSAHFSPKDIS